MSLFALGTAQTFANRLEISDGYGLVEFGDMSVEEIRRQWPGGCTALGMAQGIRVNTHKFLSGKGWSAADTFHPWYGSYCDWYNRYERHYVCRDMFADGSAVY